MKEGATDAQKAIIEQMQAVELGGAGGDDSGTASISTAVGSFTVASGELVETKKQTGLLHRIAESNERVAHAITTSGTNSGIVIPA